MRKLTKAPGGKSLIDSWDFSRFGQTANPEVPPFRSYISSIDPTTAGIGVMIGGSQNVRKTQLGTIKVRDGLKRHDAADDTAAAVKASFEFQKGNRTSLLRACNGKLQVEYDPGSGNEWVELMTGLDDDELDMSFVSWYDPINSRDLLLFVNGAQEINMWSGGIGVLESSTATTITLAGPESTNQMGFISTGGTVIINGTEYAYTAAGNSPVVIFDQSPTNTNFNFGAGIMISQLFTTSAAATQILAASFFMYAASVSLTDNATFTLAIYTDNAGVPGTLIGSAAGTSPAPFTAGVTVTVEMAVDVSPSTNYHLVVSGVSMPVTVGAYIGASGGVGTNTTVNSGISWTPSNGYLNATVTENIVSATQTLVGVSPTPVGEPAGSVVTQKIEVTDTSANSPDTSAQLESNFTNDAISVVGNQIYLLCYSSRLVHVSSVSDYTNFGLLQILTSSFRSVGGPDILILDSNGRAVGAQKGNAVVFGSQGDTYLVERKYTIFNRDNSAGNMIAFAGDVVTVSKEQSSDLSSPLGQDFITAIGDNILFLDENNQLRQYGTIRNINEPVYPILSLDVYQELTGVDFTGGQLRAVGEQSGETVYLVSPVTGATFVYQMRQRIDELGNLTAERVWQPPMIWNISRIAVKDGISYGYSNTNPQLYQLWDTGQFYDDDPTDAQIPYECHAIFAYLSLPDRTTELFFDKLYSEGYMTEGTNLYCNVYQEYQGAKNILQVTINQALNPGRKVARFFSASGAAPSLGEVSLGLIPLGSGVVESGASDLSKFRCIRTVNPADIFEFALDYASYDADSQWELLMVGANIQATSRRETGIRA